MQTVCLHLFHVWVVDQTSAMSQASTATADVASSSVIGAEVTTSDATTPSNSPVGGATPSSSSVSTSAKPAKNVDLLNNSGMGDLKSAKPYKREPLHRSVNFVCVLLLM